jgi:hypothetical protein
MKKDHLHDPDTIASYYPFPFDKRKTGAKFCQCEMDANLIWVAPECQGTVGLAHLYCDTFGRWAYFQRR